MVRLAFFFLAIAACGTVGAQSVGIVLSGGGGTAMAHIGVLKALEENGIPIDYIAGSSMGALVGGMYAAGYSPAEIDSLFRTEQYRLMAEGGIEEEFRYYFKQDMPDASAFKVRFDLDTNWALTLPTNLRNPVLIDFEQMRGFAPASEACGGDFDRLFVPFRCVASDITDNKPVLFRSGDLARAVRASMSYPFYFKPITIDGHLMMDGGLYNNFPSNVLYNEFLPDVIIGSNVSGNSVPPSEDDLMSQLRAMMQEETDYSIPCEHSVIIEPQTRAGTFDFSEPDSTIEDGYRAALARMPEIKAVVLERVSPVEISARRRAFRSRYKPVVFGDVHIHGLNDRQTIYAERVLLTREDGPVTATELKPRYFRFFDDHNVSGLQPSASWNAQNGNFDLDITVKRERRLEARIGGMFSSRPINTGMVGLRYNFFGRSSAYLDGMTYFGKFYSAGEVKLRMDLSTRVPFYIEPAVMLHRWDYYSSFATFFDEVQPSYIVQREFWSGFNAGMSMGNKGLARFDLKYAQNKDQYYQTTDFDPKDTADVTEFFHVTTGALVEHNTLNRKQHPNAGDCLKAELRYVSGEERTTPGSTYKTQLPMEQRREWIVAKVTLDKYFLSRSKVRFGFLAEGLWSDYAYFKNYTASIIRAPVFQPTPESKTYFLENFRASQYLAGGARALIAVARNKLDLRFEGYVFQPYKAIVRDESGQAVEGTAVSDRYYLASGSLIYQSPVGPVWFNTSYIDGLENPWAFSLNFGYVIFGQKALE